MSRTRALLHFALDSDTSGFFPQLARLHDRDRYRMFFGTLRPMVDWLRVYMVSQGVTPFSCECRSRLEYPLGFVRLARFLKAQRIEILHAHLFDPAIVGLSAGAAVRTPFRVLTRHHSDYHTRIRKHAHVGLDRMCTALSHAVIAVSQHTADHLLRVEHAPKEKVLVIPNGIDFERVKVTDAAAPARLRAELAPADAVLILSAGRLHPEKGYEYLLDALPSVAERVKRPWILAVAGAGPFQAAYRRRVSRLGLTDRVRFLGFRSDLPDLMAAADVFVLASVAEAFGLVLAEALYLGTPVVATTAGAIPEIVEDRRSGLLVSPGDSGALAGALIELIDDIALRRMLSGAGRDRIVRQFRFEDMIRSYEQVYEPLLASRVPAPHA